MASVTNFIRNTPPAWLRDYFTKTGIELPTPVDWDASEPEVVKPLLQAVDEMDDEARGRIINDGERVSAMADEAGQTALYSVIDDREVLDELENGHARSLWLFLNDRDRFRHAEEVRFTDERRRGRNWNGFICDANLNVRRDAHALDAFKAALRKRFASKTHGLAEAELSRHQIIALDDLEDHGAGLIIEPIYLAAQLKTGPVSRAADPVRHAAGFRHFWVGDREFKFSGDKRRQIVEYLFNAWEDGVESVSTEVMFADLEFKSSSRMRDIFKDHEDWRDLIEATGGSCRLRIRELLEEQRARVD